MTCLVHYDSIKYDKKKTPVPVVEEIFNVLKQAKNAREQLGGDNAHAIQCNRIPEIFTPGLVYHSKCYKKFTFANALLARKKLSTGTSAPKSSSSSNTSNARSHRSNETDSSGRFPSHCMICKKIKLQYRINGRKHIEKKPSKITLESSERNFKRAALLRQDEEMLSAINGVDLKVKDFLKHTRCYNIYTKVIANDNKGKGKVKRWNEEQFSNLTKIVDRKILQDGKFFSVNDLIRINGQEPTKNRRRLLKYRLKRRYGNKLLFLTAESNKCHIVCSSSSLSEMKDGVRPVMESISRCDESVVKKAAEILRNIIKAHIDDADDLPWPPTPESLKKRLEACPRLLYSFFKHLLHSEDIHHIPRESTVRLIESFSQDLLFAISRGTFLTFKHTSLGLGLHSLIGQKLPIVILSRFGQCISYPTVQEIETAQAELAQKFQREGTSLPLQPKSTSDIVPIVFWYDNFDRFVDSPTGAGSIHNTPGIAFQEKTSRTIQRTADITIPKSRKRSIQAPDEIPKKRPKIDPKKLPVPLKHATQVSLVDNKRKGSFSIRRCIWKAQRYMNSKDQLHSRLAGWVIKLSSDIEKSPTTMTYLPPIETPITDYGTIFEIFHRSEQLAKQCNMKYVHITFDCGAAMKAYHVIWNNPERFANVFLHLGDFHYMKAFFGVLGSYVSGSGFEDIVYQAGMCQPGSMKSFLDGKHYNRAFMIHESFAEAISRLFHEYCNFKVPSKLKELEPKKLAEIISDRDIQGYIDDYYAKFDEGLSGKFGQTIQYWLRYVDLVDSLHTLHYSLLSNDFDTRLLGWREMLPSFFFFDRTHYARYGSFYLRSLENIETTHPGAKEELLVSGISVRRNHFGIGQAVDLAGEQTYMRNAKTAGGITQFQTRKGSVLKWILNRPFQTAFVDALKEAAGLEKTSSNPRKCLRPSEIIKSEKIVSNLTTILTDQFLSPFDDTLRKDCLYNLVSGRPVSNEVADSLLNISGIGAKELHKFECRLEQNGTTSFFDRIERRNQPTFLNENLKVKIKQKGSDPEITIHRDVLGTLLAISNKEKTVIDINKALQFPLSPVSSPLSTCDGKMRKNSKSALYKCALNELDEIHIEDIPSDIDVYMIDLAAYIRTIVTHCKTVRDLSTKLIASIPSQYTTIYIVADNYNEVSIKGACRQMRGSGTHYVLRTPDMLIPYDIQQFLSFGENKEVLFELIKRTLEENPPENRILYFCSRKCTRITTFGSQVDDSLACDHEEADTKFVAYSYQASAFANGILIRSPSGDIDITLLLTFHRLRCRIYLDNGTLKNRHIFDLNDVPMPKKHKSSLLGNHSFGGNDFVGSFFRKGKTTCWSICIKSDTFLDIFDNFGDSLEENEAENDGLQKYVCAMYGQKKAKNTNEARAKLFWDRFNKKGKICELSMLPPCVGNLLLHIKRSRYVAYIYKHAHQLMLNLPSIEEHGWSADGETIWMEECLPEEYNELLVSAEQANVENDENGDDDEDDYDIEDGDIDVVDVDF